ncbi:MAG: DNA adenine methylase, partial [Pedobacter sp.]
MDQKIKPIIKWTGGKYREFALFKDHIPTFERYIEPFFGGGGVFFSLQPKTPVIINDKSTDLIQFYKQIGENGFKISLYQYATAWEEITQLANLLWEKSGQVFSKFIQQQIKLEELAESITAELPKLISQFPVLSDEHFTTDAAKFFICLKDSMLDKSVRIQRISGRESRVFDTSELKDHFETGIKSGMYLYFRMLMNKDANNAIFSEARTAANWYFVREFCYASMFRFNAKGEFNIPYGGIAYNKKNFRQKADLIFAPATQGLFENAEIHNQDFEALLSGIQLKSSDFI